MSKRQWMISIAAILVIALLVVWSKMNFAGKNRIISEIQVDIESDSSGQFLSNQEVVRIIQDKIGNPIGKPASDLQLTQLELHLMKVPYIENANIFVSFDGKLKTKIIERKPIIRITNQRNKSFYLDTFGIQMPLKKGVQPNVLVANGIIPIVYEPGTKCISKIGRELIQLATFFASNELWNAQFEQCYVDKLNRYLLIPRVGKHSIVLDNLVDMSEKFENLRLFYVKGLPTVGWNRYTEIDISYENQIIGRTTE